MQSADGAIVGVKWGNRGRARLGSNQ
jgi:hypothetical protein